MFCSDSNGKAFQSVMVRGKNENLNVLVRVGNGVIDSAWRFLVSRDVRGWMNEDACSAKCLFF